MPISSFPELPEAVNNPILIVEVLSESTSLYDRQGKFQAYQSIETFKEYVLISQDKILVEVFYKPKGVSFWHYQTYTNLNEVVELKSISVKIQLSELYEGWVLKTNPN